MRFMCSTRKSSKVQILMKADPLSVPGAPREPASAPAAAALPRLRCARGEAPAFIRSTGIGIDGGLPLNTHGGLLSHSYLLGVEHVIEAVRREGAAEITWGHGDGHRPWEPEDDEQST